MKIAIFRHGDSLSIFDSKVSFDLNRVLSEKGIKEVKTSALKLKEEGFKPLKIISSNYTRAVQSSEIIADVFNISIIYITHILVPDSNVENFIEIIKMEKDDLIVVSHMPLVENIVFFLSGVKVRFKTGSYVNIELGEDFNAKILSQYFPH